MKKSDKGNKLQNEKLKKLSFPQLTPNTTMDDGDQSGEIKMVKRTAYTN